MKQFALKQSPLSLVRAPEPHDSLHLPSLDEFLDAWVTTVNPTVPTKTRTKTVFGKLPLTTTDVMQVNRATVRESLDHRHWPPDVVLSFMRADVIKRDQNK